MLKHPHIFKPMSKSLRKYIFKPCPTRSLVFTNRRSLTAKRKSGIFLASNFSGDTNTLLRKRNNVSLTLFSPYEPKTQVSFAFLIKICLLLASSLSSLSFTFHIFTFLKVNFNQTWPIALLAEWYQVCFSKVLQALNRGAIIWNYWKICSLKLFELV